MSPFNKANDVHRVATILRIREIRKSQGKWKRTNSQGRVGGGGGGEEESQENVYVFKQIIRT